MDQNLIENVIKRVKSEISENRPCFASGLGNIGVTEFVGTATGTSMGLVIASADPMLVEKMKLGKYRSIGIIGGRSGAGPQAMAVDDAVKATNAEVISFQACTDGCGGPGQGSLIVIGAEDVSDARRAVEIALAGLNDRYFGDVYENESGFIEFQYTARASSCLELAFGAKQGKAFGLLCCGPAVIGSVVSDTVLKAANVEAISYMSPSDGEGFTFSNEIALTFTGDSGAVRQALRAGIDVGKKLLTAFGQEPKSVGGVPYI